MSHHHHHRSPLPPPPLPPGHPPAPGNRSGGYPPLPPPLPYSPPPPPPPSHPPPPLFPSPSPPHHSVRTPLQPPVLGPSEQLDYSALHRDRPLYVDTPPVAPSRGGPPAINYGNELSRERLPYSQTLSSYSSGHAPLLHNRDHFEQQRHENSALIDFTSDSTDRDTNPHSEYQPSEERQLSSTAGVDLPPWLRRTEGHTDTTLHKPFQHGYQRDGGHNHHTINLSRPLLFHPGPQDDNRGLSNPSCHQTEPSNYRNTLQYPPPLMGRNFHRLPPPVRESQWSNRRGAFESFHPPPPSLLPNRVPVVFPPLPTIQTVPSEKLFDLPGRKDRPSHIVIVLRGLPGSGKSHLAKIIRDKEVGCGSPAPRILALDLYFLNEVEKTERDPETGRRVKRKVEEYEFDAEMEPSYRNSLFKSFNTTLDKGFFPMVIVDAVHEKVCHFDRYWSIGKMKGFQVYIAELDESVDVCVERNTHNRTKEEIEKLQSHWEATPPHFTRLDVTALLSNTNIDEVEMECNENENDEKAVKNRDNDELVKSRWDDPSEYRLDKMDAVGLFRKRRRLQSEEEGLSLTEYLRGKQEVDSGPAGKRVPKFSLYEEDKQLNIEVHKYHSTIDLSPEELAKLKLCHEVLFTELLKITHSCFHLTFDESEKDYLVVPLSVLLDENPLEAFLNMEVADSIIELKTPSGTSFAVTDPKKAWPLPPESFHNALVMDVHRPLEIRKLYEVVKVDKATTLQSPFPYSSAAATYLEYFQKKYNCQFTDLNQPALDCKPLGLRENRLKLLKSRYKSRGEDVTIRRQSSEVKLFPELCTLYPVPTTIWKIARCLPSILWRLECTLSIDNFRSQVALETGIGCQGDSVEISTETYLHGYEDHGFGELLTQKFTTDGEQVTRQPISTPDISVLTQRGPDNALLLQAFTPKGANDSIDLERLETLGDSFLKLATTVFLFHDRTGAHEGNLSSARSRRVENLNLYLLAKKDTKKITEHILSTSFEPRQMWIPPCFSFVNVEEMPGPSIDGEVVESQENLRTRHYLHHKVTDKGVADCVESLIGAYLVSGGIDAALKFMKWVGIKIQPVNAGTLVSGWQSQSSSSRDSGEISSASSSNDSLTPPAPKKQQEWWEASPISHQRVLQPRQPEKLPLYVRCSSSIFRKHFPHPPRATFTDHQKCEIEKLLEKSYRGNKKLKDFFDSCIKDKPLLLQALTHASYIKNRVTGCYQRLEFLGDAVLDYLITCHIYSSFSEYTPGEISAMRTALVNNNTFAELSVELELHRAVLHLSPSLFSQINTFVGMLSEVDMAEGERVVLTSGHLQEASSQPECASSAQMETVEQTDTQEEDAEELDPPKVLGDVLESVAGAIYLDSGCCLETVWRVFKPYFEKRIRSFNGKVPVMPVQELLEREPTARTEKTRVGRGVVRCTVSFVDKSGVSRTISAKGKTFKGARTAAAKAALKEMDK